MKRSIRKTSGWLVLVMSFVAVAVGTIRADIPTANLKFWVRADAGVTVNGSGEVTEWADQTPGSSEVAGSDGTNPTLVENVFNGKPAIHFDGDDRLRNNRIGTAGPIQGEEITAFIVARRMDACPNTSTAIFLQSERTWDYSNLQSLVLAYEGSSNNSLTAYRAGAKSSAPNPGTNAVYLFTCVFDGATNTVWRNRVQAAPVASTDVFDIDYIVIGQRYQNGFNGGFIGDVAELIVYDSALSITDREQVWSYLESKYGVAAVTTFAGSGPGDGLDLSGNIRCAVNVGGNSSYTVGNVFFQGQSAAADQVSISGSAWSNGPTPDFDSGGSEEDAFENMLDSLKTAAPLVVELKQLTPGRQYKVQLLMVDTYFNAAARRICDIVVKDEIEDTGIKIEDKFDINAITGGWVGESAPDTGAVCTFEFTPSDSDYYIYLQNDAAILNALTIESPAGLGTVICIW